MNDYKLANLIHQINDTFKYEIEDHTCLARIIDFQFTRTKIFFTIQFVLYLIFFVFPLLFAFFGNVEPNNEKLILNMCAIT